MVRGLHARSRKRLAQVLVLGVLGTAAALTFGTGSALASGSVFCPPYGTDDASTVQADAAGGGTVLIKGVCSGTVTLSNAVTLQGMTPGATSGIDGSGFTGPAITVTWDGVKLQNLLVTGGGSGSGDGGGVWDVADEGFGCGATLNIVSSHVTGNTIDSEDAWGAGINAEYCTDINVTNTIVDGNSTTADLGNGAGIALDCAEAVNVSGSTIRGNSAAGYGGGIFATTCGFTTLSVVASTISGNTSAQDGGGIYSDGADVLVQNSTLAGNSAFGYGGGVEFLGNQFGGGDAKPAARPSGPQRPQLPSFNQHRSSARPQAALPPIVPTGLTVESSNIQRNTAQTGAGGGIDAFTNCEGETSVTIDNSSVAYNRTLGDDLDTDSGGGGYSQYSDCSDDSVSLVATNSGFGGNTARSSVGGGIFNVAYDGSATVALSGSPTAPASRWLNANQARWGGGVFNWGLNANTTLLKGSHVIRNQALVTGGGVYNDCGATLTLGGGFLLMNSPNNVFTNLGPCLLDGGA